MNQIRSEIKQIVQRCCELFNESDIPLQAFSNLQIDEDGDQLMMTSGLLIYAIFHKRAEKGTAA